MFVPKPPCSQVGRQGFLGHAVTIATEFDASSAMWYNDFDVSGFVAY